MEASRSQLNISGDEFICVKCRRQNGGVRIRLLKILPLLALVLFCTLAIAQGDEGSMSYSHVEHSEHGHGDWLNSDFGHYGWHYYNDWHHNDWHPVYHYDWSYSYYYPYNYYYPYYPAYTYYWNYPYYWNYRYW